MKKLAEHHFRSGKDRKEVAKALGITLAKLYKLFGGKEEVSEAEKAKALIEYELESALIKKACGYSYTEVKETEKPNGTEVTTTYKEVAPDIAAARVWLENRCPEDWSQKSEKSGQDDKLGAVMKKLDERMSE